VTASKPKRKRKPYTKGFCTVVAGRKRDVPAMLAFIKSRHAEGECDFRIAQLWNEKNPHDTTTRFYVAGVRKKLGLRKNSRNWKMHTESRRKARMRFAVSHGWPADLSPRCVQVLDALYEHGPMTKPQIAEKTGLWLNSQGNLPRIKGGFVMDILQHRGIVQVLHKCGTDGKRRRLKVFALRSSVTRNFDGN